MGIALPQWIIEGKNNIWVLGLYGVLFGGVLPVLVVRSIFSDAVLFGETRYGNARTVGSVVVRQPTKDKRRRQHAHRRVILSVSQRGKWDERCSVHAWQIIRLGIDGGT